VTAGGHGGALYLVSGRPIVESCTIITNILTPTNYSGGGLYLAAGSVTNTIIYHNYVSGVHSNVAGALTNFAYSCAPELTSGTGNTTVEPLFVDMAGGDWRLRSVSPSCINKGINIPSWMTGALDLAGKPRILNGVVDIGAYETPISVGTLIMVK